MAIQTVNPATAQVIHTYTEMPASQVSSIIQATHQAFLTWRELSFTERAAYLQRLANRLRQGKKEYAVLIATEMGKPLAQGQAEIEKCAWVCEHYAKHAEEYLTPRPILTEMRKSEVSYSPLGIVLAIMPWNFPFWQVFRFLAPTLMAGNAALLKHAPISTGSALAIEHILREAGFLENIFRSLVISEDNTAQVIAHTHVAAVTFTGSTRAGKIVAALAGNALKKSVLELGGNDAYLILHDADLEQAATACVTSRMNNAGQSCIAAKRLITVPGIHEKFLSLVQEKLQTYSWGHPLDEKTTLGPLARKDLRDKVHEQVAKSVEMGAQLLMGGCIPAEKGFYYPATLIDQVKKGMPAYAEEIFGPVIAIIPASDEEQAISIANDSRYGLGAAIFTQDLARGERIAREKIQAGTCTLNTFVSSDPRLPFGGIKESGYGRELSAEGIRSFMNVKVVSG